MHCEFNFKQSLLDRDVFGRLTPPPEDFLEMEQDFLFVKPQTSERKGIEQNMEVESSLLDLEYESICAGEFDGFKINPTLAELNDTRSRSPLINPEMKRLHQMAIQTVSKEVSCDGTLLQTKSQSVLEQQLRTQPLASICQEQFYPNRNSGSVQLSPTVNQPEAVAKPNRHAASMSQVKTDYSSSTIVQPDRKVVAAVENFKTQSIPPQLISPHFVNNYGVSRGECNENSTSHSVPVASREVNTDQEKYCIPCEDLLDSGAEKQKPKEGKESEQYDPSDDEDFDSEDEVDEAEEYCPYEKGAKNPTRRKGRKSESEDMVPNPTKLLNIVRELDRLNKIISDLKPINELPQHSRGRSRKEKNKLASRACRLKKKQQHEANKVKLHGLASEQENLTFILNEMKNEILSRAKLSQSPAGSLIDKIKNMEKKALSQQIAGHTTDYVRKVLKEVADGKHSGGLCLPKPI